MSEGKFGASWIDKPWIRCADQMPPEDTEVLVYADGNRFISKWNMCAGVHIRWQGIICQCYDEEQKNVTHWQSLPAPPQ